MASVTGEVEEQVAGYAPHAHRPLAAYAGLTTAFAAAFGGSLAALHASGRGLPERPAAADIALAGIARYKAAEDRA